jgi:hypothetical protein
MTRTPLENWSTGQAIADIASSMLNAAADALEFHGPDPLSNGIMVASFAVAIEKLDKQKGFEGFKRILMEKLAANAFR